MRTTPFFHGGIHMLLCSMAAIFFFALPHKAYAQPPDHLPVQDNIIKTPGSTAIIKEDEQNANIMHTQPPPPKNTQDTEPQPIIVKPKIIVSPAQRL